MGEDALSPAAISTSKWNAADYAKVGGFVAELGGAALDLLDPQPGERILDVGCGEGTLTRKIMARGAEVLGVDDLPEMVRFAREKGVDAVLMDAADMPFVAEFDAAFSNAVLHWVLEKEQAARAIFRALKPGGRFAGEMGGEGNLAAMREALDTELVIRGYVPPVEASNWYASPEEFAAVYEAAGFGGIDARLIERPTADRAWLRGLGHDLPPWLARPRRRARGRARRDRARRSPTGSGRTSSTTSVCASS